MNAMGIKIKEISIEMTDEPVTKVIDEYLPWLKTRNEKKTMGAIGADPSHPLDDPTRLYLTNTQFKQGVK